MERVPFSRDTQGRLDFLSVGIMPVVDASGQAAAVVARCHAGQPLERPGKMRRVVVAGGKRDVGDVQVGISQQVRCDRETRLLDNSGIGRAALRQPTLQAALARPARQRLGGLRYSGSDVAPVRRGYSCRCLRDGLGWVRPPQIGVKWSDRGVEAWQRRDQYMAVTVKIPCAWPAPPWLIIVVGRRATGDSRGSTIASPRLRTSPR